MKKLSLISLLFGLLISSAHAAENYIGQFVYQYEGGVSYRVVSNDKLMTWECIEGPEKGAKGEESPERFEVADGLYFVSWVEKTGIHVSQALDLKKMKVYSTVIDGKERFVLVGNVTREK